MAKSLLSSLRVGLVSAPLVFACLATAGERHALASGPPVYPATCAEVKPEAADEARKAFVAGKAKSDESAYDDALVLLVSAYQKDCTRHTFLQVIATVLEKQSNYDEAIRALRLYLERQSMTGVERAPIDTKIKNLQTLADKKRKDLAAAAASGQGAAPPPELVILREHTAGPWVVFGAGVLAVGTGIVLHVAAPAFPKRCNSDTAICQPDQSLAEGEARDNDLRKIQDQATVAAGMSLAGTITLVGGGVLMVGGLVWHFLEPTGSVSKSGKLPQVTPTFGRGYGGLSLGGSF
jgi:hypothetical protein